MRLVGVRRKERERATSAFVVDDILADPTAAHVGFLDGAVQASAARRLAR
jgi:hypothetical protein